jgi:D-aminopeptidase
MDDATEEAILNALCQAVTTTGINDRVVHAIPLDRLRQIMAGAGRIGAQ